MKIQIDTDRKTLRIEGDVYVTEFIAKVKSLFPNGKWKEYKLETNVEIVWSNPIYLGGWSDKPYPWIYPVTYTNTDASTFTAIESVYNVEV